MRRVTRRTFLRAAVQLGAGAVLYKFDNGTFRIQTAAGPEVYQLRIVHTNDHHSRIEPAPAVRIGTGSGGAAITRDLGGVARRKTLFDQIRAEPTPVDKLFLDAGDVFQGTLYFNQFEGAADLEFYKGLDYHAGTIGNHEFDKGDQVLANFIAGADYPIVSANIAAAGPSPLNPLKDTGDWSGVGKFGDRTIVTLTSGKKIGIFGLTTPETPNISSPSANVTFNADLVAVAQAQIDALKLAGADIVVALTHIGYLEDIELARNTRGLSVIVGGHSHTPLLNDSTLPYGQPRIDGPYPTVTTDLDSNTVLVITDWEWGKWVGDIVIGFDAANLVTGASSPTNPKPVWAGGITGGRALLTNEGAEITPDAAFQTQITTVYKPAIDALSAQVIGATTVDMPNANVRLGETLLGNLFADAFRARLMASPADNPQNLPIVAIINGGGLRTGIPVGDITLGKLLEVIPFGNTMARVDLTGAQIKAALENAVSAFGTTTSTGRFAQVSGLRFWFSKRGMPARPPVAATSTTPALPAQPGSRVSRVEVVIGSSYQPLDPAATYRVVTNGFMLTGGDGYFVFTPGGDQADPSVGGGTNQLDTGLIDADVVSAYITANSPVAPQIEGRIQEFLHHQILTTLFQSFTFPATP